MEYYEYETISRLIPFISGLILFSAIGFIIPFRKQKMSLLRLSSNILLTLLNSSLTKLLMPFSLGVLAIDIASRGWGLFHWLNLNFGLNIFFSIVFLDLVIYWQHRLFHLWSPLWRLHRVHHTDTDFDASTALRFHPLEIILSTMVQAGFVILLGVNFWGIVVFGTILNFSAMFNHANFSLPKSLERLLVKLIVTPDMHRVHHSVLKQETNSNFGFFFSIWDRLFNSYTHTPQKDPETMPIGIESFRDQNEQRLDKLILQPFRRTP